MKLFVSSATTALCLAINGADALVARDASCSFQLTATGSLSGTLGQLDDGQVRVGGGLSASTFYISSNGGITDSEGRGCILTPPTSQFQCDTGASATTGFTIGCGGTVSYGGTSTFIECPTGDNGASNIYQTSIDSSCSTVTLTATQCHSCPAPPPPPPPPPPAPTPTPYSCPAALSGTYEFPHLITPISSTAPDEAFGTVYNGQFTSTVSTIFNFDIPPSAAGRTCTLVFLFPTQAQLTTSSFTLAGADAALAVARLATVATAATTFNSRPPVAATYGTVVVAPGNAYTIASGPCAAGTAVAYSVATADARSSLTYFQDYNPSPIGFYVTIC